MKIIALQAENVKRLKAVEIRPDGNLVVISGKNGAGKTSVLDAIFWGLAGASHIQAEPIRKDADSARIKLDLGELVVTRTFNRVAGEQRCTTSLTVESADGARYRSPQTMLDALLGELAFDPLEFARSPAKDQIDMLRRLVPDFDFEAVDVAIASDYDKRRDVNRRLKELRANAAAAKPEKIPEQLVRIDTRAIVDELEAAGRHNAEIEATKAARERRAAEAKRAEAEALGYYQRANDLQRQVDQAKEAARACRAEAAEIGAELEAADEIPAPIDTAEIRACMESADATNDLVDEVETWQRIEHDAKQAEIESERLTRAIDLHNESKAKAIAAANLPVPGLSFGSGDVELAGLPFDQASDAEQLRTSVAIAAALNPKLRVVRVRHGNDLDEDWMKLLGEFADAHDMQIWCERVDDSGKVGFVIQDGSLVEAASA